MVLFRNVDRSSPWPALADWTRDFDQLFSEMDHMMSPMRASTRMGLPTTPMSCDIHETEAGYLLSLDLPGVKKEDIEIESSGNTLIISGTRSHPKALEGVSTHRLERKFGAHKRTFTLPDGIDASKIQANLEDGVLQLSIPKVEAAKPKKIEVSSGKTGFLHKLVGKKSEESIAVNI